jgi:hypothetical protein
VLLSRPPAPAALLAAALLGAVLGDAAPAAADPVWLGAARRGELDGDMAQRLRASLERSLAKQGVPVLDTSNAAGAETNDRAEGRARAALDEAKQAFTNEDWRAALAATDAALAAFEKGPAFSDDEKVWNLYRDILSLKALTFLEMKKKTEADDALRALLVVMPGYAPKKDKAPPELLRHLEDVKDELRSLPPATLEIRSKPAGGTVFVDGRRRGKAPLIIEDLAPGVHYVAVVGTSGRHIERLELSERGAAINAKLGSKKSGAARDVVRRLERPMPARALVDAVSDINDDALVAVLLPHGKKKADIIAGRVVDGEVKVVVGVRAPDTDNDRERATYNLVQGLLDRSTDAWLDEAKGDDPKMLRELLFTGVGTLEEDEEPPPEISPAVIAVGVIGGIAVLAGVGTGVGIYVSRELQKDEGFTWSVDTSGL